MLREEGLKETGAKGGKLGMQAGCEGIEQQFLSAEIIIQNYLRAQDSACRTPPQWDL